MISTVVGYINNDEETFRILKAIGFQSKSEHFEQTAKHIIIESGYLWFAEVLQGKGRFFDKHLTLTDIVKQINSTIDFDNSCIEANIGTLSYLIAVGYKPSTVFSNDTKFFVFNSSDKTFSGVSKVSYAEKRQITLIDGKLYNVGEPVLNLTRFKQIISDLGYEGFILTEQLKEALCLK